ncbi:hypothetical protein [Frankia sp. R82]|uniref:hypothetical protein n=1 Tax=Frankia sp. R82 TaxID=2950553 RepID=UPI0020449CBA|nr:hypothetical protein [Frankia sp. R82]MCM3883433.1 hypothetical protein [Frankia sp. R82]
MEPDSGSGHIFTQYAIEQLASEENRRNSLTSRASATITASAALVTLLFGFVALSSKTTNYHLPVSARPWLVASLTSFTVSAVAAALSLLPFSVWTPEVDDLQAVFRTRWDSTPDNGRKTLLANRLSELASLQHSNNLRAWLVLTAIALQVIAAALLSVAMINVIAH